MITPIVLAGGSGTRLWPLSRQQSPKQFLRLTSKNTMLQETCNRIAGITPAAPLLITNEEHRFIAAEQMRAADIPVEKILLEPAGRNTAPAIALGCLYLTRTGEDPIVVVLPADHHVQDVQFFQAAITSARALADEGYLVTFGVRPDCPETGYGYIRRGGPIGNGCGFSVDQFVEKPDQATAQAYLDSGDYYWNSGIFMFKASRFLQELEKYRPDMLGYCEEAMKAASHDTDYIRPDRAAFTRCPEDSIDYAVMEHSTSAATVVLDCGWSDLGSWTSLWKISQQDARGNSTKGDVLISDSDNCYLHSESRLVVAVGLSDIAVIDTDDAVLVTRADRVQDVKKIVERLRREDRPEVNGHRKVYRPWGYFDSIDVGSRFQVKRIVVDPGAKLSLQMHHHRAEHWVVVSGTAMVTCGEKTIYGDRKRIDIHSPGRDPPPGEPRQYPAGNHRSAIWLLSGRGRYCTYR